MVTTRDALRAVETDGGAGLAVDRYFTAEGIHPYDELDWELRDAVIKDWKTGGVAFEQRDVEFPTSWSMNATTIVAQKYFRGHLGTPQRERSVKHMIDRVADTITGWGRQDGYFADDESAEVFNHELKHLLVTQKAAFNSPVWFNCGVEEKPQCSACFILSVEDRMTSILNWYVEEGTIFKGGSGSGVNLSKIRSSAEPLRGGGSASGPVSFMRGADASAGTIKSGGKTRRAAKMVILNIDHPDVEEFVWCKQREEQKSRALEAAGFDMSFDSVDSSTIQYQNANNSVRVNDTFMEAVERDEDFDLKAVTTGETVRTVRARDLMDQVARAAWECADPGVQYDTTINDWHTTPNAGRINGSNPCFPGDAMVHTDKGLVRFDHLLHRVQEGEAFAVYTHDATNPDDPAERIEVTSPEAFMITGRNPIVRLRFSNGMTLRCTPGHKIFTVNRGYVAAEDLDSEDRVKVLNLPTPATQADLALPVPTEVEHYRAKGDHARLIRLPEKWSEDLAHYLGYHTGDGAVSGSLISTIYGNAEEQEHLLPQHGRFLAWLNGDQEPKPSVQANGTQQLRLSRRPLARFFDALGMPQGKATDKHVPWSVFEAPSDIVAAYLRGLFDADGCAVDNEAKGHRYVGLGSSSRRLLEDVQRLLSTFGIHSRVYQTREAADEGSFSYERNDGSTVVYGSAAAYQLRVGGRSLEVFASEIGFTLPSKARRLAGIVADYTRYETDETVRLAERADDGFELTYNLSEPRNHSYVVNGVVVRNCSEYMHLDNSACNLASLNLRKFEAGGVFDVDAFTRAVEIVFTAQEIIVGNSSYPTDSIAENARAYRQLGLGYANLGGLLMSQGIPYDSDEGRAWAASITALMTGHAYRTSAELAKVQGPFDGYDDDRVGTLRVLRKHRDAVEQIAPGAPANIIDAARHAWADAVESGTSHGVRNAQATVLAPTGTIGLMMDCDTTGIEPDLGLVKMKKLSGGGTMKIVNRTVPVALAKLGYQPEQVEAIVDYIDKHSTIEGAPAFRDEHLPVFDCAMGERTIKPMGHVRMMGAVQPFISGAISKTVNLPESASVDDVAEMYMEGWRLGLKAIAIYRDNCKVAQPLSISKAESEPAATKEEAASHGIVRRRLPKQRPSQTISFTVGDAEGYVTAGEYPGDGLGEVFVKLGKQGSTLSGVMDAFAIAVSIGLQYGVPLEEYVKKFINMRFEPAGMTDDPEVKFASSVIDYLFRRLAMEYLPPETRHELGIFTIEERTASLDAGEREPEEPKVDVEGQAVLPLGQSESRIDDVYGDAPMCFTCGVQMQRSGSCHVCTSCGTTSGCS
jgi:ribonucleoside-diphosphate reductase alpha chain